MQQANKVSVTKLDEFPFPIWRSGLDARCDYFNKSWLAFTGRTFEQELGDGWAEGVHPDDRDRCVSAYLQAFHARQPFELQYRLRRYDGEYRWIVDIGKPIYATNGTFAGYIGCGYDITERKQAEEERAGLGQQFQEARANSKFLEGILPICASCKKIRDEKGQWQPVEVYISIHSLAQFSHGVCPECLGKLYSDLL